MKRRTPYDTRPWRPPIKPWSVHITACADCGHGLTDHDGGCDEIVCRCRGFSPI